MDLLSRLSLHRQQQVPHGVFSFMLNISAPDMLGAENVAACMGRV